MAVIRRKDNYIMQTNKFFCETHGDVSKTDSYTTCPTCRLSQHKMREALPVGVRVVNGRYQHKVNNAWMPIKLLDLLKSKWGSK